MAGAAEATSNHAGTIIIFMHRKTKVHVQVRESAGDSIEEVYCDVEVKLSGNIVVQVLIEKF